MEEQCFRVYCRIKRILWYSILVFALAICISCTSYRTIRKNNFINGSILTNTKIPLQGKYFGDMFFIPRDSLNRKQIHKEIKVHKDITWQNLIAIANTNSPPNYQTYLFYKKNKTKKISDTIQLLWSDSLASKVLYRKMDTLHSTYLYVTAREENTNYNSILKDGESIIHSLKFTIMPEELSYHRIFETYKNNPNYLIAINKIKNAPFTNISHWNWDKFQYLSTLYSFIRTNSQSDSLRKKFEKKRINYLQPILDSIYSNSNSIYNKEEVYSKLQKEAFGTRIVMLNENHWYPNHRIFAFRLLEYLVAAGYNTLAVEALRNNNSSFTKKTIRYPTKHLGYYIQEPFFGHLIRKAKELGLDIIAYESSPNSKNREKEQAHHIKKYMDQNPKSKVFIYSGLDHIFESPDTNGKRMAQYLRESTRIDPLTINQAHIVSNSKEEVSLIPTYLFGNIKKIKPNTDYFLINNLKPSLKQIFSEDQVILHNLTIDESYYLFHSRDLLVSVFYKDEFDLYGMKSIPIVNTLLHNSNKNQTILELEVPKSELIFCIMDSSDRRFFKSADTRISSD